MNFPDKKYQIILADPGWDYKNKVFRTHRINKYAGSASWHYKTMNVNEIKNLPVKQIADKNCILFLWTTFPNLQEGLDVIKAWDFTYKTLGFSWLKTNKKNGKLFFGIGHYTKSNCEVCLIGVKGKPKIMDDTISSAIISSRREHSKKPDIVRDKIVQLCGDLPRIELFARQKIPNWDAWGDNPNLQIKPLEIYR
jgi:N6-adenosine-specific RNA methylase IME4